MSDIERAADSYATFHDCSSYADTVSAFRAGARWQREQHEQEERERLNRKPTLCTHCGQPTMHLGNVCYSCCQKTPLEREQGNKIRHGICLSCNRTSLDLNSHVCEDPMINRVQEEQNGK